MIFAYRPEFATSVIALAFQHRGWQTVASDSPGDLLMAGKADIVLTTPLEYAQHLGVVDYALVPEFGISTQGFAGVMKLIFKPGLASFATVCARDPGASETIAARIILAEKHDIEPKIIPAAPNAALDEMLATADAALLFGDDALFNAGTTNSLLDISDEWEDMTEGPLPYMVAWGRVGEIPQEVLDELKEVRDRAMLSLADAAATHARSNEATGFYQHYLAGDIKYSLDAQDLHGLEEFFRYAFFHVMIPDIPSIKFLPDGEPGPVAPLAAKN